MKPTVKIASLLMAVLMLFSVFASGCSLNKEWSYKTKEQELAIGVYLTAMQEAYTEAQNYASSLDDYDATSEKWLDLEITDSDGNKQVAKDWIKETAERRCLELLAMESELKKLGATNDEAELKTQEETYETQWYSQDKAKLEKLGVSLESYKYYKTNYSRMRSQLFDMLYAEGGTQEASKDEITKYLTDTYGRYQIMPVSLTESTTDEEGTTKDVALSDDAIKKITDEVDAIVKKVNAEKDSTKAAEVSNKEITDYLAANEMESTQTQNITLSRENPGITNETLKKAFDELEEGKAVAMTIGEKDDEKSYFYMFRYNSDSVRENYIADGVTDESVLQKMKSKEYTEYLKKIYDGLGYEKSSDVDKYNPDIFFEKPAETSSV